MNIQPTIFDLFNAKGSAQYFGEPISQTEHALQTALLARQSGAAPSLVIASLLHDIGHLLHGDETAADAGIDVRHEDIGAKWLAQYLGPEVTEPIRLHVAAKRYLCATDPAYLRCLSHSSVISLNLQGGPFSSEEANIFAANRYSQDAINLRVWDDDAKVAGLAVPALDSYVDDLSACLI